MAALSFKYLQEKYDATNITTNCVVFILLVPWLPWTKHESWTCKHVCPEGHAFVQACNPTRAEVLLHVLVPCINEIPYWMKGISVCREGFIIRTMNPKNFLKTASRHDIVQIGRAYHHIVCPRLFWESSKQPSFPNHLLSPTSSKYLTIVSTPTIQ